MYYYYYYWTVADVQYTPPSLLYWCLSNCFVWTYCTLYSFFCIVCCNVCALYCSPVCTMFNVSFSTIVLSCFTVCCLYAWNDNKPIYSFSLNKFKFKVWTQVKHSFYWELYSQSFSLIKCVEMKSTHSSKWGILFLMI